MQVINDDSETGQRTVLSLFTDIGKFFAREGMKFKTLLSLTLLALLGTAPMVQAQVISVSGGDSGLEGTQVQFMLNITEPLQVGVGESVILNLTYQGITADLDELINPPSSIDLSAGLSG